MKVSPYSRTQRPGIILAAGKDFWVSANTQIMMSAVQTIEGMQDTHEEMTEREPGYFGSKLGFKEEENKEAEKTD